MHTITTNGLPPRGVVDSAAEQRLRYEVDPSRNYRREVDLLCPPWQPEQTRTHDNAPGVAFSDNSGPRIMSDAFGERYSLPHTRYVRAINPQGHVVPLQVSTCRPSPEYPDGDDRLGTEHRVVAEKVQRGWRILDEQYAEQGFAGRAGDEYLAWCLAVRDHRLEVNRAHEEKDRQEHESKALAAMRAQLEQQANLSGKMVADIASGLGKAIVEAQAQLQSSAKPGKPKAE